MISRRELAEMQTRGAMGEKQIIVFLAERE